MNTDYFRDFALGDDLEKSILLPGVKGAAQEFAKIFEDGSKKMTKKKAAEMVKKVYDYVSSKGIVQGALNEGVEEVMEEGVSDMIKGVSMGLNYLGLADSGHTYNFGFSAEDFLSRYGTAFFGGAIGGAIGTGIAASEPTIREEIDNMCKRLAVVARRFMEGEIESMVEALASAAQADALKAELGA